MKILFAVALIITLSLSGETFATPQERALSQVGVAQRLGETVPADLIFVDRHGHSVPLRDLLSQPSLLVLAWYRCRNLCSAILSNLAQQLQASKFAVARDFRVIVVSIDPAETPADAAEAATRIAGATDRWQLLTGDKAAIERLAAGIGFVYSRDPDSGQYAHPAGLTVLTADGRVSSYLLGIDIPVRDLELALTRAGEGGLGSMVDQLVLRCFHFDPHTGTYTLTVLKAVNIAGLVSVLMLLAGIAHLIHRRQS